MPFQCQIDDSFSDAETSYLQLTQGVITHIILYGRIIILYGKIIILYGKIIILYGKITILYGSIIISIRKDHLAAARLRACRSKMIVWLGGKIGL